MGLLRFCLRGWRWINWRSYPDSIRTMAETTDVSTGLKPEFVAVVDKIYRDLCNLQPGTSRIPSSRCSMINLNATVSLLPLKKGPGLNDPDMELQ